MTVSYYPGCTLKTKARNLEDAALASVRALGLEMTELPRWNCCGAVHGLADDNLLLKVAPVRDLVRAKEAGSTKLVTLCSMCYNTLARANEMMRDDEDKRHTINLFMDEEQDYAGEVEVLHFLTFLEEEVGWDALRDKVVVPLSGLKVAPYYGCTLTRPAEVSIDERPLVPTIMARFLEALGAEPVDSHEATTCCGSFQVLANPEVALKHTRHILAASRDSGADVVALSCPLCEFNMGARQKDLIAVEPDWAEVPTLYFTQLLAIALGLGPEVCRTELNQAVARGLLADKNLITESS